MALPLGPIILAAANFGKSELVDKPQAEKRRQTEAQITRWSPWTGMKGQTVYDPSSVDALIQGGFQGYNLQQNIQDQEEQRALRKALTQSLWNQISTGNTMDLGAMNSANPYTIA